MVADKWSVLHDVSYHFGHCFEGWRLLNCKLKYFGFDSIFGHDFATVQLLDGLDERVKYSVAALVDKDNSVQVLGEFGIGCRLLFDTEGEDFGVRHTWPFNVLLIFIFNFVELIQSLTCILNYFLVKNVRILLI